MALIRIEAKQDEATGLYYLEIYHPADASAPFVTTVPRYRTAAAAETDLIATIAAAGNRNRTD